MGQVGELRSLAVAESQWLTEAAQLGAAHHPDFMALAAHGTRPSVPSQAEQAASSKQISLGIERRVDELIERIRPNKASDTRRKIASDYVKGLIRGCFSPVEKVEAFMFGSVPLKTYLPDGDIDLAMFQEKGPKLRESWTTDLKNYLESETAKAAPQYRIKDVQIINAEVKLLKCLVDNIVVDISFDTIAGICTVLFLESIDRLIGQEHLFKRSIILVKAWCYYESRLLGANHSLLSTYALETMVLYIFNMYVEELSSPLKVLRKFLDVFSTFDWDSKALSLQGPIPLAAFDDPEGMKAELRSDVMLKEHILESMLNMYRPPREQGRVTKAFIRRFNIVDPLLPTNNLGKSINIASKYRIREALTHGSRALTSIFAKTGQEALDAVDSFFESTWGAQATPASHLLAEAHPLPPLMLPLVAPPQQHLSRQNSHAEAHALAAHAAMGSYTLAAAQNGMPTPQLHTKSALHSRRNSSDDSEGRNLSRTFSGPLPERPRSSASNASTGSDTQPNTPPFSMTRRGAAEAWARVHPSRPGSLLGPQSFGADMNGAAAHMRHDSRLHQGHVEHASSNGGIPNGHMMASFPAFLAQGVPYHMAVPASHAELLRYHHLPTAASPYGYAPPVSMVNGHMYSTQQPIMYPVSFPGPVPVMSHQHQNGNQAPRSEPAQGKRGASVVSSTAQEAKEDLLAGDLELLSGHLEKAKRCHIHVTSADTSSSAAPAQTRPAATQQARPAPESPTVSQQQATPAMAPQTRQPTANSQRPAQAPAPARQGQPSQPVRPPSQAAGHIPSYKAAATKALPPRSTSFDGADLRRMQRPSSVTASPAPAVARTAAPSPAAAGASQPWSAPVAAALSGAAALHSAAARQSAAVPAEKPDAASGAEGGSTALPAPPPPINILRRPEATEDSLSAQLLPPGPPLTPSTAWTAQLGQPLELSSELDEARSIPDSSHGSDARSMQTVTRSEVGSPVAGNAASAPGLWASRSLTDGVRQAPQAGSSSSLPAQQQQRPPAVQPMGHYQSAVLGLGRPHPKSPQPAAPPPQAPAQHAASVAPVLEQQKAPPKAQKQQESRPGRAAQATEAAQLPGAPAPEQKSTATPTQTPAAKPATTQFTLSDGDFPTLGVAGTGRRRRSKAEDPSPSSSAAATPKVGASRLPSFSASSSPAVPRWGPAAKAQQAPAQNVGSSPAAQKWAAKPDAKAAVQLVSAEPDTADKGSVSRSEGSSPTAAGQKGSAWTGQISHAVLTSAAKSPQPQASPSARGVAQRPALAQPSSQTCRTQQ